MQDAGAVTPDEAASARDAEVVLEDRLRREEPHGQYFKEQVRQSLVQQFGWERVYQGGLRVYTTIDSALQPKRRCVWPVTSRRSAGCRGLPSLSKWCCSPCRWRSKAAAGRKWS